MTVYWMCAADPKVHLSGGVRKIGDLHEILLANGIDSKLLFRDEVQKVEWYADDLVVFPEVFGTALATLVPAGVPRVSFVQNGYLLDVGGATSRPHPLESTPDLVAVMTESDHTTLLVKTRCPNIKVPVIRTHSSGNGRMGKSAGFKYGPWPRDKRVLYFGYKHEGVNAKLFDDIPLPSGWEALSMTGKTDAEIVELMRTSAVFAACNVVEGMCAPTSEAMISGAAIVTWPGGSSEYGYEWMPSPGWVPKQPSPNTTVGGPMEYLEGRATIAPQDDIVALRDAIVRTAQSIESDPKKWANDTAEWSAWFQKTYSRQGEIDEILAIMADLEKSVDERNAGLWP